MTGVSPTGCSRSRPAGRTAGRGCSLYPFCLAGALLLLLGLFAAPALAEDGPQEDSALAVRNLAQAGQFAQAVEVARRVLKANPGDVATARLAQDLLRDTGHPDQCASVIAAGAPALVKKGLTARLLPPKKAQADLADLLKQEGASELFRLDLARAWLGRERAPQAEAEVKRYLAQHPEDAEAHTLLGDCLSARGKRVAARAAYEAALDVCPGLAAPTVALARLHANAGRDKAAAKVLGTAVAAFPDNPILLLAHAEERISAGELETATLILLRSLPLEVEQAAVHARLSEVWRMREKLPAAEASAKSALGIDPDSARALRTLAFVKQKKKDFKGALELYAKAAVLRPRWAQIHADIGFIHVLLDEGKLARKALGTALDLDKQNVKANLELGLLRSDGYRCQYNDPDWEGSTTYGSTQALDCFQRMGHGFNTGGIHRVQLFHKRENIRQVA